MCLDGRPWYGDYLYHSTEKPPYNGSLIRPKSLYFISVTSTETTPLKTEKSVDTERFRYNEVLLY